MFLLELYNTASTDDPSDKDHSHADDYRTEKDDETPIDKTDTRKARVTLSHLNKLRQMRDARDIEKKEEIVNVQQQYGGSAEDDEFGGGDLEL